MTKKKVRAQALVDEALSWVGTPFAHQQHLKGVGVDCANFIREVSVATGATPDVEFERNYRRREDGTQMLAELVRYMEPVGRLEEARPADVIAMHDGKHLDRPKHLAFLTRLEPYPKMVHASERGVVHHRIDAHFKGQIHSIWRRPGLRYD
jgi:hypothetical protein